MRLKALAFGLVLVASACTTTAYDPGSGMTGGGGTTGGAGGGNGASGGGAGGTGGGGTGGSAGGSGSTGGTGTPQSGTLAADATWDGLNHVTADVTVPTGVTLTIDAGAQVQVDAGKAIIVAGTLKVNGTAASTVVFTPTQMGMAWAGIEVNSGGAATVSYAELAFPSTGITCAAGATTCASDHTKIHDYSGTGLSIASAGTFSYVDVEKGGSGGLYYNAAAGITLTITDSTFHITGGDAIVADGAGNLTFQYNKAYGNGGTTPGVHCACHFASTGTLLVDHNEFDDSTYASMLGGMSATSKINYNNFVGDMNQYSTSGAPVNASADLTHNWWGSTTPPTIQGNTTDQGTAGTNYLTAAFSPAGPR